MPMELIRLKGIRPLRLEIAYLITYVDAGLLSHLTGLVER